MSVTGLHPEDLLDKLEDGTLAAAEARQLRAHLASCAVCNVELALRGDFSKDWLVHNDVIAAPSETEGAAPRLRALSGPLRRRKATWICSGAAAVLLMGTAAMASGSAKALFSELFPAEAPLAAAPATPRPSPPVARDSSGSNLTSPSEPAERAADEALAAPTAPPPIRRETASNPSAGEGATSPAALFSEANRARDEGRRAHASSLYRRLQREFPKSGEADTSRVTLALLLLDSGDPRGALASFDKYLARPSRPLEAEALIGRARAFHALGNIEAEAGVWRAVAQRFPGTSYAHRATKRLAELGQH
jgi:TolA-binding protein